MSLTAAVGAADEAPFDILITGGRIIDGTGNPWFDAADVGIRDGKIAAIGRLSGRPALRTIDAGGLMVSPGFIDMLGQSEVTLLVDPHAESKIRQGITTEITGEGGSIAPQNEKTIPETQEGLDPFGLKINWRSFTDYFARLEKQGVAINFGTNVGATQARWAVMGSEDRAPTPAELDQMKQVVDAAMRQGAMGLSTSLVYAPAIYAKTEELIELAKVAAGYGGIYSTHMRNEGDAIDEALDEAIRIGREAAIAVHIYHLKLSGKSNWGRMGEVSIRIQTARAEGVEITANMYPYVAGATSLSACLPPWALDGGLEKTLTRLRTPSDRRKIHSELSAPTRSWQNFYHSAGGGAQIMISFTVNENLKPLQGMRLAAAAAMRGQDELDALLDILIEDRLQTGAIYFLMSEKDVADGLVLPWVSIGCDSPAVRTEGILGSFPSHPRAYGTFPRVLGHYARDQKLMPLAEAVRKMTLLAAQTMRIPDRGLIKVGMAADVVCFDPARIRDTATFEAPNRYSEGVRHVIVNGVIVLDDGEMTGALPGKILRGRGYKPAG